MTKNKQIFKHFRLFFTILIAFLCSLLIDVKTVFANSEQGDFSITYSMGSLNDIYGEKIERGNNSTVTITDNHFDKELFSVELAEYNKNNDLFNVLSIGKIFDTDSTGNENIYDVGFAGWKLTKINGSEIGSDEYFYPSHDYIYLNDEPFVDKGIIESLEFEAIWGKTIYLRDEYNFKDITNVFGDNGFGSLENQGPQIDWDTSLSYAYPKEDIYLTIDQGRYHSKIRPVYSLVDAVELLGETGGVVEIVNHYTLDHMYGNDILDPEICASYFLGQNIKNGVLTLSGLNNGYNNLSEIETEYMEKEAVNLFEDNKLISSISSHYDHAYLYFKNTIGEVKSSIYSQQYNLVFCCDASIEGLNITGYRETYHASNSNARHTYDAYIYGHLGKRFIIQDDVAIYKKNLTYYEKVNDKSYGIYNADSGNWSHKKFAKKMIFQNKELDVTIDPFTLGATWLHVYTGFTNNYKDFNRNLSYNTSTFDTSSFDAPNAYLTVRGYKDKKTIFYSAGVTIYYKSYSSKTKVTAVSRLGGKNGGYDYKNVHLTFNGAQIAQLYGIRDESKSTNNQNGNYIDFYGISLIDSTITSNIFTTVYNTSSVYVNDLVIKVDADPNGDYMLYKSGDFSVGGMSNVSDGSTQSLLVNNVNFYFCRGYCNNIFAGGNQIAVQTTYNNFKYHIYDGTINEIFGGGLGGFLTINNDINFNIYGGKIKNIYGGGSGGLVTMSSTNGVSNFSSGYEISYIDNDPDDAADDYYYYGYQFVHNTSSKNNMNYTHYLGDAYKFSYVEINSKKYTTLNVTHIENANPSDYAAYYRRYYDFIVSDALVTVENIIMVIDTEGNSGIISGNVYGGGKDGTVNVLNEISIQYISGQIKGNIYGGGLGNTESFELYSYAKLNWLAANYIFVVEDMIEKDGNQYYPITVEQFNSFYNNLDDGHQTIYERALEYDSQVNWKNQLSAIDLKFNYSHYMETRLKYGSTTENVTLPTFYVYSDIINDLGKINGNTSITMSGGSVNNIYGASEGVKGNVTGSTNITITGGTISGNVYGGGNLGGVSKNDTDPNSGSTNITIDGNVKISGDIYGGSNKSMVEGDTQVVVNNGTINGTIFGGGNLGTVEGSSTVIVNNTTNMISAVFAGGNQAPVNSGTNLAINGGKITTAFGGGNLGIVDGNINVTVNGNPIIYELYAASNRANVVGDINLDVDGGTIAYIFGGNNLKGDISGNITININSGMLCALYGGGNQADFNNITTINFNNGTLVDAELIDPSILTLDISDNAIYGGGKVADVNTVVLNINSGVFQTSIYGGGYQGDVSATTLNITGGVIGTDGDDGVFGGGYKGEVATVNLTVSKGAVSPTFDATLYGGGEDGRVTTKATVKINGAIFKNDIYGAGKGTLADTTTAEMTITNSTIDGNVYGGGNAGKVLNNLNLSISDTTLNNLFGGGNLANVDGIINVSLDGVEVLNNFYGGGNLADIDDVTITVTDSTFDGVFYGGGNQGDVDGNIGLTVNSGVFANNVYGGGNQGNVTGNVTFNIFGGQFGNNIYGGGYAGTVSDVEMTITDRTSNTPILVSNDVFAAGEGVTATVMNTDLLIDLIFSSKIDESLESSEAINSGEANINFDPNTDINAISKINGCVYGGGDLGQISDGVIDLAKNTATITTPGSTNIQINNGYIGGSVFAGGRGVAPEGMSYNVYMGTVFGSTSVTVLSGYIGESVYGGGRQSRVYAYDNNASTVLLNQTNASTNNEVNNYNLIIQEHVFGGGYRGNSESTNATVPTTVGNVSVTINGSANGTAIYFISGGVYGDGDLCLVSGRKTVNMTNFTTGNNAKLKTFYSLQRADEVVLTNSDIVLLGAIDKVEEGDTTLYSINRIKSLIFNDGSTIKLTTIVKYLESITSNYTTGAITPDRIYIDKGYNGDNLYNKENGKPKPLTPEEINNYRLEYENSLNSSTNCLQNTISVANSLYLELTVAAGGYGKVKGLFTLQLLIPKPGEGGGIVYADITTSTGDFICLTKFEPDALGNAEYMDVLDDVCRYEVDKYTAYFWYIAGTRINYSIDIVGYIGTDQESFGQKLEIPKTAEEVDYVLSQITIPSSSQILAALTNYTLVQKSSGLSGNQFAVEISFFGETSGFLSYNKTKNIWGISPVEPDSPADGYDPYANDIVGYLNAETEGDESTYRNNALHKRTTFPTDSSITIYLHKSSDIDLEFDDIDFNIEIHLFNDNIDDTYAKIKGTTNEIFFECHLSIQRLVPLQYSYAASGHLYAGVGISSSDDVISITRNSSVTLEVLTRYIPGAFKKNETNAMEWFLKSEVYNYYFDDVTGYFLVTDINQKVINYSTRFNGCFTNDEVKTDNDMGLTYNPTTDTYSYKYSDTETRTMTILDKAIKASRTYFPVNTTITLVDRSNVDSISVYYYQVTNSTTYIINILDFMRMGSNKTIRNIIADENDINPTFISQYEADENENMRVAEDLVFIFDFTSVNDFAWNSIGSVNGSSDNQFITNIHLAHIYQGDDIMDYIQKPKEDGAKFTKETPKNATFRISSQATGLDNDNRIEFEEDEYHSNDTYEFELEISEDIEWSNTEYQEREYSVILELVDQNGQTVLMPEGMKVLFGNKEYYSKNASESIIIPVKNSGIHQIKIQNNMYGLYEHLESLNSSGYSFVDGNGNYIASFRVLIYSSVYDEYYNELRINIADLVDSFVVKEKQQEALEVTIDNRIVKNQEIILNVRSALAETAAINVYYKNANGGYEIYSNRTDFLYSSLALTGNNETNIITIDVNSNVRSGTYKIEVTAGNRKEFVTVIIINDDNSQTGTTS